jgi:hypothetical protein
MAQVNVENIEKAEELFIEKLGFGRDSAGLELSDDQLVNFLMLCYQTKYGIGVEDEEVEEEVYEEEDEKRPDKVKVKVMRVSGKDMGGLMDELLGHGGPKVDHY